MKVLRFKYGIPEWLVPVDELSADLKSMLRIQWREFIHELSDVDKGRVNKVDPIVVAMLERSFIAADGTDWVIK